MSPEQLDGDVKEISFATDVWAIGIVWHEMLTNFTPFEPATAAAHTNSSSSSKRRTFSFKEQTAMLNQLLEEGPRKLPMLQARKVPPPVTGIIAKCLSVEKRDRHNDAQDLFSHIDEVFEELEKGPSAEAQEAAGAKPFKSWRRM